MKRAAIIIGVDKAGTLPKLRDAARGADRMAEWAQAQGMATELITDANGPVDIARIKTAIRALVDAGNIGQLLVYFAGHGVNRLRQEYWLLTDAPDDTQAAVNLAGSVALAATCGIPHVVFVSDACRTAAEGIRAQSITGSEIFPNREGDEHSVDQFFACDLGRPSHEVRDPDVTTAEFSALYTGELLPALNGECAEIVEWKAGTGQFSGYIHPRPLRDYMSSAVTKRLKDLELATKVIQVPTARISSDPPAWLSEVRVSGIEVRRGAIPGPATTRSAPSPSSRFPRSSLASNLAAVQEGRATGLVSARDEVLVGSAVKLASPFGPMHHETECGFKIRGARIVRAYSPDAQTDLTTAGDDVRVYTSERTSVLLVLDSGIGALLPAIRGFITALTVDEGELVDVAYEPSDNNWRWSDYRDRAGEIRALRAIVSSSMTHGVFRLERNDALEIAKRMQYAKGFDPSLAVYAAYAYHDLQRRELIREMAGFLERDLGAPPFDVALLARLLDRRKAADIPLLSPFPLLSQGWALLRAYGVSLPESLAKLDAHMLPSLWTLFDDRGVERIGHALATGAIR